MKKEKYETYVCSYNFEGSRWGIELKARSFEDARARLQSIGYGEVDGVLECKVPVWVGPLLIPYLAWRNWVNGGKSR